MVPPFLPFLLLTLCLSPSQAATFLKYNCGGLAVADYAADPASFVSGPNQVFRGPAISGLTVGISHRWATDNGFAYNFPIGDGTFNIDLIFAEVYAPLHVVGGRIFSVAAEDDIAFKDLDVFKEAGPNKELKKTITNVVVEDGALTVAFLKGTAEHPMVSAITITKADGTDITLGNNTAVTGEGTGTSKPTGNKEYDHQAHAVSGGPYKGTDYNNNGIVDIDLDGTQSHSHYNNPDTGESGRIEKYEWSINGKVISTAAKFKHPFSVTTTEVLLKVEDQKGDAATAKFEVKGLPSTAGGAYCYYYPGVTVLPKDPKQGPRPVEGHPSSDINFDDDEFAYTRKDDQVWAARCVTDFASRNTTQYKFSVTYEGAGAILFVNNGQKTSGGATGNATKTISSTVTISEGLTPVQVLYYRNGDSGSLSLLIDDAIAAPKVLGFKASSIVPTISSTSASTADPAGGGQLQIIGTGFVNKPTVNIGNAVVEDFTRVSSMEIVIRKVPSAAAAGQNPADIFVSNAAGVSNKVQLNYSTTVKKGVSWEQTYFKTANGGKYGIKQISSIAVGPDASYYLGSLSGFVTKLQTTKDLIVTGQCASPSLGASRAILGMAFHYASKVLRLYVTTNSLYSGFGGGLANQVDGWANGAVESLTSGCGCLCYEKKVVTGLPVSNHDHGVNSLLFLDNGDLLITIGGSTNAGHNTPGNKLGGWPETPLSGAIVVAKLSKGASFDGNVKYDQYTDPAVCKQTSGDVEVYASGLRNSFGVTQLTNGEIWATDNGGNFGYGDVSKSCTENVPFSVKQYDEINLIQKGKYYGHPNRNRGECVHANFGGGEPPKKTVFSSTNAIVEYTSNAFSGSLKGELCIGKYAASGSGLMWRWNRGSNNPIPMADYSGLSVVNGLHGELVAPRVQQGFIAVLKPQYAVPAGPMMIAVSPRKGTSGQEVFVAGENFGPGLSVKFGTKAATGIRNVGSNGFFCKVPDGTGKVSVIVTVNGAASANLNGVDFIYL